MTHTHRCIVFECQSKSLKRSHLAFRDSWQQPGSTAMRRRNHAAGVWRAGHMMRTGLAAMLSILVMATPAFAADGDAVATDVVLKPALTNTFDRPATRGAALPILYGTLAGLQAYDGWSTLRAVKAGA